MNLSEHLNLRTPLLWVTTDEPGRVVDTVISTVTDRNVYRNDAIKGFIVWDREQQRWLKVLVDMGGGTMQPTADLGMAVNYVLEDRGVFILENAHTLADALSAFLTSVQFMHRNAFKSDDLDLLPPQFIMLSFKDKLPDEFVRTATRIQHELPDAEELTRITQHIMDVHQMETEVEVSKIVRSSLGMSEQEFINTALLSIRDRQFIDPIYVGDNKLEQLKRDGILEVRQPKLTINDLGGMDLGRQLVEDVAWTWNNPEQASEFGVEPLRRVLLVGVPGTGKSLLCEATSSLLGLDLAKGGVSNAMSKWVGESEQNMRKMFAALKVMAPIVFWIDEFGRDMSGGQSSAGVDGGVTDRVHGEFLTGLQELQDNIFLMAAANNIESLAPEMLRADRFDKIMFSGFPTHGERIDIFKIHLGDRRDTVDVEALADRTPFFTGAEIKAMIRETRSRVGLREKRHITTKDILDFIPQVKGRVWTNRRPAMLAMYERAIVEWDWCSSAQKDEAERVLAVGYGHTQQAPVQQPTETATYKPKGFTAKWG